MVKSNKKTIIKYVDKHIWLMVGMVSGMSLVMICLLSILIWYQDRTLPNVVVLNQPSGNQSREVLRSQVESRVVGFEKIVLQRDGKQWELRLAEVAWRPEVEKTIDQAVAYGKNWQDWKNLAKVYTDKPNLPLAFSIDQEKLKAKMATVAGELYVPVVEPEVQVNDGEIVVTSGTEGQMVDLQLLTQRIWESLSWLSSGPVAIPIQIVDKRLSLDEKLLYEDRARKLLIAEVGFDKERMGEEFVWTGEDLIQMIAPTGGWREMVIEDRLDVLAEAVNVEPKDAIFVYDMEEHRVKEFAQEVIGRSLDKERAKGQVLSALSSIERQATSSAVLEVSFIQTYPEIRTSEINDLGIEELLGRGESYYRGSISGRRYNVKLAAGRVSGSLIKPGEVFSFNKQVGEVNAASGFKQAYVIRSGQTVLDDGGGVCQVSTTIFRAALAAGLPITERHAHSYRVGYYEQGFKPGIDATVYAPSVDLIFENDTSAHLLVQTTVDEEKSHLTVEIFGTSDGRMVTMSTPRLWSVSEPPPDLYVDDASLKPGEVKQVEYKAWGAKAAFDWKVVRGEEVLQERTFYSNYKPWQAVYLRGV